MRPIPDALPPHRHRTGSSDDAGARMGVVAYEFRRAGAALFRDARVPGGGTTRRRSTAPPWPGHRAAASARGHGRKGARAGLWPIDTSRPAGEPFPPPPGSGAAGRNGQCQRHVRARKEALVVRRRQRWARGHRLDTGPWPRPAGVGQSGADRRQLARRCL